MSKAHPTPSQLRYRERQKEKKAVRRYERRLRWTTTGCLQRAHVDTKMPPVHDLKPWSCDCSWGCDMCHVRAVCQRCGDYI